MTLQQRKLLALFDTIDWAKLKAQHGALLRANLTITEADCTTLHSLSDFTGAMLDIHANKPQDPPFVRPSEVAAALGISVRSVYNQVEDERIPSVRLPGSAQRRIPREWLKDALRQRETALSG